MKHLQLRYSRFFYALAVLLFISTSTFSQSKSKQKKIIRDAKEAKAEFIKADPGLNKFFNTSYGYVIFPNVGKGGIGIGGATGNGVAWERGSMIGMARLSQLSIGFQLGGQAYREVIFFESKADMEKFKNDNLEFAAQASAVVVASGASADAKYSQGVVVFTKPKGGLMYEASIGGQHFNFNPF